MHYIISTGYTGSQLRCHDFHNENRRKVAQILSWKTISMSYQQGVGFNVCKPCPWENSPFPGMMKDVIVTGGRFLALNLMSGSPG